MTAPSPTSPAIIRYFPLLAGLAILVGGVFLLEGDTLRNLAASFGLDSGGPRIGSPAPDFALRDLNGREIRLSGLRGRRVVLNFWATWCPPCRSEMPDLDAVAREQADRGVVVLPIDQLESAETVRGYLRELSLGLAPVLDDRGEVAQLYRVNALPTSFFVDEAGVVRDIHIGPLSKATIRAKLAGMK